MVRFYNQFNASLVDPNAAEVIGVCLLVARPAMPSIQITVPAIYHNALPPSSTSSTCPGTLSTSTLYATFSPRFPMTPRVAIKLSQCSVWLLEGSVRHMRGFL